jgi:hypothetical protein
VVALIGLQDVLGGSVPRDVPLRVPKPPAAVASRTLSDDARSAARPPLPAAVAALQAQALAPRGGMAPHVRLLPRKRLPLSCRRADGASVGAVADLRGEAGPRLVAACGLMGTATALAPRDVRRGVDGGSDRLLVAMPHADLLVTKFAAGAAMPCAVEAPAVTIEALLRTTRELKGCAVELRGAFFLPLLRRVGGGW